MNSSEDRVAPTNKGADALSVVEDPRSTAQYDEVAAARDRAEQRRKRELRARGDQRAFEPDSWGLHMRTQLPLWPLFVVAIAAVLVGLAIMVWA